MQNKIWRGDLYCADLNPTVGSEQGNRRPVLIVQNDAGNEHSPTVVVVPLTRNLRKSPLPTHVRIAKSYGLETDSLALVEQIRTIDRSRLTDYIGHIGGGLQLAVDKALAICVGLENRQPQKSKMIVLTLCRQCESDFRNGGSLLVKVGWQEVKEDCDFCKAHTGLNFAVFEMKNI